MEGHVLAALFPKKPAKPIFHTLWTKRSSKSLPKEISRGALYASLGIQNLPPLSLSINLWIQRNLCKKLTRMRSQIWSQIGHKFDPSPRVYTMHQRRRYWLPDIGGVAIFSAGTSQNSFFEDHEWNMEFNYLILCCPKSIILIYSYSFIS